MSIVILIGATVMMIVSILLFLSSASTVDGDDNILIFHAVSMIVSAIVIASIASASI